MLSDLGLAGDFELWWDQRSYNSVVDKYKPTPREIGGHSKPTPISLVPVPASTTYLPPLEVLPHFEVRQSAKGGYGAFARLAISEGTVILSEVALIEASWANVKSLFAKLSTADQAAYMRLHGYKKLSSDPVAAIYMTNNFRLDRHGGIFKIASRFNHHCEPSVSYHFDKTTRELVFTTKKDIKTGEEITISYGHDPHTLLQNYGFYCDCGTCYPPTPESERLRLIAEEKSQNAPYEAKREFPIKWEDQLWRIPGNW